MEGWKKRNNTHTALDNMSPAWLITHSWTGNAFSKDVDHLPALIPNMPCLATLPTHTGLTSSQLPDLSFILHNHHHHPVHHHHLAQEEAGQGGHFGVLCQGVLSSTMETIMGDIKKYLTVGCSSEEGSGTGWSRWAGWRPV